MLVLPLATTWSLQVLLVSLTFILTIGLLKCCIPDDDFDDESDLKSVLLEILVTNRGICLRGMI